MQEDYEVNYGGLIKDTGARSIDNIRREQERISEKISRLRLEQSRALAEHEARKEEDNSQGVVKKFIGFFTGKNMELKRAVEDSDRRAQAAGHEIERLLEQNNYLQAEANRMAHLCTANTMKNIATEVVENIRDNQESSRRIDNLENQIKKIVGQIGQIGEKLGEKISSLEDQNRNILKLVDSVSRSTMDISNNISKNYKHFVSLQEAMDDTFQKMNGIVEHQENDILNLQKKVEELFDTFKELLVTLDANNKIMEQQVESISGLSASLQQEMEHGRVTDTKLGSLDEINIKQAEINLKQNEINTGQFKSSEKHQQQIHKLTQILFVSLTIGSLGIVAGIILMIFHFK